MQAFANLRNEVLLRSTSCSLCTGISCDGVGETRKHDIANAANAVSREEIQAVQTFFEVVVYPRVLPGDIEIGTCALVV